MRNINTGWNVMRRARAVRSIRSGRQNMTMKFRVYEGYGRMVAFYDKTDSNGNTVIGSIMLLPPRDAADKIRSIRLIAGK